MASQAARKQNATTSTAAWRGAIASTRAVVTGVHNTAALVYALDGELGRQLRVHEAAVRTVLHTLEARFRSLQPCTPAAPATGSHTSGDARGEGEAASGLPDAPMPSTNGRRGKKKKKVVAATAPDAPVAGRVACPAPALVPSSSRTLCAKTSRERTPPPRAASPAATSTSSVPVTTRATFQEGSEVYINGWRETHGGQLLPGTDMTGVKGVVAAVLPDSHCSVRVGFNLHSVPDEKLQSSFVSRPSLFG